MEKISDLVITVGTKPQPSECKRISPDLNLGEKIWTAGGLIFGEKWPIKNGELPGGEWFNVLLHFDEVQISAGINRMRKDAEAKIRIGDEAWPPNAFEFACYCKTQNSLYFPDSMKALPPPRPSREFAAEQIAKIREKL